MQGTSLSDLRERRRTLLFLYLYIFPDLNKYVFLLMEVTKRV